MNGGNLITEWRSAVVAFLEDELAPATVRAGRDTKANREAADLILVFWPGWPELPRDIALATPTLTIRYFPSISKQPTTTSPRDEEPLEQAAVALMVAMAGKRKTGDFVDGLACRISKCVPNPDPAAWYVEATVQAYALNLAASAA
jgi:hypothetical protein